MCLMQSMGTKSKTCASCTVWGQSGPFLPGFEAERSRTGRSNQQKALPLYLFRPGVPALLTWCRAEQNVLNALYGDRVDQFCWDLSRKVWLTENTSSSLYRSTMGVFYASSEQLWRGCNRSRCSGEQNVHNSFHGDKEQNMCRMHSVMGTKWTTFFAGILSRKEDRKV